MTKNELRSLYKERRNTLARDVRSSYDIAILSHLKEIDWSGARLVHLYMPIASLNEPDTLGLMRWLKERFEHIQVVLSKSDFESGEMTHFIWNVQMVLQKNTWGILEPIDGTIVDEADLDVIVVPLLVVDKVGNRVGYGKGFYDRFLAKCRPDVKCVGLSYFEPITETIQSDPWDIKLTCSVSPKGLYRF